MTKNKSAVRMQKKIAMGKGKPAMKDQMCYSKGGKVTKKKK